MRWLVRLSIAGLAGFLRRLSGAPKNQALVRFCAQRRAWSGGTLSFNKKIRENARGIVRWSNPGGMLES